jgi:hypothetical protein
VSFVRSVAVAAALSLCAASAQAAATVLTGSFTGDGSEFGGFIIDLPGAGAFGVDFLGCVGHVDLGPGAYKITFSATANIDDLRLAEAVNDDMVSEGSGVWSFFDEINDAILDQYLPGGAGEAYHAGDVLTGTLVVPQNTSFVDTYPDEIISGSDTYRGIVAVAGTGESDGTWRLTVSGIPEPASWGLMIAGFGLAGGALRGARARRALERQA